MRFLIALICVSNFAFAQNKIVKNGQLYFSWGYNKEWYTPSTIHVKQPDLGNDYQFVKVAAHDQIGWDKVLQRALTIPQYNYRLGYFFNEKQDLAFELNFDHTKFVVTQGQNVRIKGTLNNKQIDSTFVNDEYSLRYKLNNGANFFLFNLVKKINIYQTKNKNFEVATLLKGGIGPVVPHVENTILGNQNKPHFQIGGWNAGVEGTLRIMFFKYAYLEYCIKGDYAHYFGLRIYKGRASQTFGTFEMIGNFGVNIPLGKKEKKE